MFDHEGKRLRVLSDAPGQEAPFSPDRRRFLALVAAQVALAKMGCTQQPPERIVPYVRQPEESPPGTPLFYATSMVHGGLATGLLAKSVTGRPIKVEGNPDHPASLGATDAFAQASIFSLYDPDRASVITRFGRITTWPRFIEELGRAAAEERAGGGAAVRLLTETVTSPSLAGEINALLNDLPAAQWHRFEPAGDHQTRAGMMRAFGRPVSLRHDLTGVDVLVTLDSDLLGSGPGALRYSRDFARRRHEGDTGALGHTSAARGELGGSPSMNRLYSIESVPTCTGTLADHRLALRPTEVASFAAALAARLGAVPGAAPAPVSPRVQMWADAVARDLRAAAGRSLIVAGEACPAAVHVLVAAMNEQLGNAGKTVLYTDPVEASPVDHLESISTLATDMHVGRVRLLIILGGNPVYNAPADLDFAAAMRRVRTIVHLSPYADETAAYSHYHVPEAHFLESWGDARAFDGTVSLVQPLVEPLRGGRTPLEIVAALRGQPAASMDVVKRRWQAELGAAGLEETWQRALSRGFLEDTQLRPRAAPLLPGVARTAAAEIAGLANADGELELAIRPDPTVDDGRFSDNGWLQELPKPQTKQTWENAAWMSPATAAAMGLRTGDVVQLAREGRTVTAPVLVVAGHADATVTIHLGYGRTAGGAIGRGLGFDAYPMRTTGSLWYGSALLIRKVGEGHRFAVTQGSFDPHGRPNVRVVALADLRRDPHLVHAMGHAPGPDDTLYPEWEYVGQQWGMSIDQTVCTGCSACVIACQAENNVPVVGREEVQRGREMHWLRIDRYEVTHGPELVVVHQPMMCVHCEKAPCELVCPVGATTHSADGLNEMTYNRCVGTRYCQNNCPYKVRRFNFFDYHAGEEALVRLGRNPEVTVRSRGVMEKCTYCVQRVSAARITSVVEGRPVRDGEVTTACQSACPTGAIAFGDIHDPAARVRRLRDDPRSYGVLAELNTRPRTTHMARVRNPNPELAGHG